MMVILNKTIKHKKKLQNHLFPEDESSFSPTFAYFGDFGYVNAVSLPQLQDETHHGLLDLLIHAGDFAYDLDDVSRSPTILFPKYRKITKIN